MEEIWKDIPGYTGHYQVSNIGRVKSVERKVKWKNTYRLQKGMIRKLLKNTEGYYKVGLFKGGVEKKFSVHQLVAMAFLEHSPSGVDRVVDHIDRNPSNNNVENLRIVSTRENNMNKSCENTTSRYIGVYKNSNNLWTAGISIQGKNYNLFSRAKSEKEANNIYQKAYKNIEKFNGDIEDFKRLIKIPERDLKKYSYDKSRDRFVSEITIKGIKIFLKRFKTKEEAVKMFDIAKGLKSIFDGNRESFRKIIKLEYANSIKK